MKECQSMKYSTFFEKSILILNVFYRKENFIFETKNSFS